MSLEKIAYRVNQKEIERSGIHAKDYAMALAAEIGRTVRDDLRGIAFRMVIDSRLTIPGDAIDFFPRVPNHIIQKKLMKAADRVFDHLQQALRKREGRPEKSSLALGQFITASALKPNPANSDRMARRTV